MLSPTQTRPGAGWKHVSGAVWDHESGLRLHTSGMLRTPGGEYISGNCWPETQVVSLATRITGSRRRGLMLWALWVLKGVSDGTRVRDDASVE